MAQQTTHISWDTSVKHFIRLGLFETLPDKLKTEIPKTNLHRWRKEPDGKYVGYETTKFIKNELELFKDLSTHKKSKKLIQSYFKVFKTFQSIVSNLKGYKQQISLSKSKIVNRIEKFKKIIPVNKSIKIFAISRATYQNYKTIVLNKCDNSYFLWCVKNYPNQLLKKEVFQIKKYMELDAFKYWAKASIYFIALKNNDIGFCLTTWYKYCKLLGYNKSRHLQPKFRYNSLISTKPNEIWCADITILKTTDNVKHYIHFLMDHFSKKILEFSIENSASPKAIKYLLQNAFKKCKTNQTITLLTDGGCENVNNTVCDFITINTNIKHLIAQKDIPFSNSKIEAFNKIIKHQFLLPKNLANRNQLIKALPEDIHTYNTIRPQLSMQGNTPDETFYGKPITITNYNKHFSIQKQIRISQNQQNTCMNCKS